MMNFKHILNLSLVVWAHTIYTSAAASPEQCALAGLQQCFQSVWDWLGTAGAVLIISMAAEDSPALQESSAAAFILHPLFYFAREYIFPLKKQWGLIN